MDCKKITNHLILIHSATVKAEDDGLKRGNNNEIEWCLRYMEDKIQAIREEMSKPG